MARSTWPALPARARRALSGFLSVIVLAGCYRTTPVALPAAPETRIVATLTPEGRERMAAVLGPYARNIEAIVVEVRPEGWELRLLRVEHFAQPSVRWNRELVLFPTDSLTGVQERKLDLPRTALLLGGLAAGLFRVGQGFGGASIPGGTPDTGSPLPPQ